MCLFSQVIYYGGYSGEDPPLTIPNREVKLTIADGTDPPVGRVGSRRFRVPDRLMTTGDFFLRAAQKPKPAAEPLVNPRASRCPQGQPGVTPGPPPGTMVWNKVAITPGIVILIRLVLIDVMSYLCVLGYSGMDLNPCLSNRYGDIYARRS